MRPPESIKEGRHDTPTSKCFLSVSAITRRGQRQAKWGLAGWRYWPLSLIGTAQIRNGESRPFDSVHPCHPGAGRLFAGGVIASQPGKVFRYSKAPETLR